MLSSLGKSSSSGKGAVALDGNIDSSRLKMLFDMVPDYAVDIPLIWQYIGEILGKIVSCGKKQVLIHLV